MNTHIIYRLVFPNNKVYIGQTIQEFKDRLNQYKSDSYNKKRKFYNSLVCKAIRKHDWNNVKKEIICTVSEEFVDDAERYFIKLYKSNDRRFGYNLEDGGNKNKHKSKETILKISGENHPMYGIKRPDLSERNKNNPPALGYKHSEKTKQLLREIKLGKTNSKKWIPVNVYDKISNNFIGTFESIKQASIILNVHRQHISSVCKNKLKSIGGYIFKYNLENK